MAVLAGLSGPGVALVVLAAAVVAAVGAWRGVALVAALRTVPSPARRSDGADRSVRDRRVGRPGPVVRGVTPTGAPAAGGEGGAAVLVFVTSSCVGCLSIWTALGEGRRVGGDLPVVLVTPDPTLEDARRVATLAPPGIPVVMAASGWRDYDVTAAPTVVVIRDATVVADGSVDGWDGLRAVVGATT